MQTVDLPQTVVTAALSQNQNKLYVPLKNPSQYCCHYSIPKQLILKFD